MKLMSSALSIMNLINIGFKYVIDTSQLYKIDESHAVKHSMEVYGFAKKIYESEFKSNPYLEKQREIIYMASIGHDMCDKKYMNENEKKHLIKVDQKRLLVLYFFPYTQ